MEKKGIWDLLMNSLILEAAITESWHGQLRDGIKYVLQLSHQRDKETDVFTPKLPTLLVEVYLGDHSPPTSSLPHESYQQHFN